MSIVLQIARSALFVALGVAPGLRGEPPQFLSSPAAHSMDTAKRERLSLKTRRQIFEKVWREIRDRYYDASFNGVNWDEIHTRYRPLIETTEDGQDCYSHLNRMTGELHDAHTRFNSPEQWKTYRKQQGVSTGISVE